MIVKQVAAQLRAASQNDPGQITTGFYVVEDGVLVMTHSDGAPVDEFRFRHRLQPKDNEEAIASIFTRQIRTEMLGEQVPGFTRSLDYPNVGVA